MKHKTIFRAGIFAVVLFCIGSAFFAGKYSNKMRGRVLPLSDIVSVTYKGQDITKSVDLEELSDYLSRCVYDQTMFSRTIKPDYYDFAITMSVGGIFHTLYLEDESTRMYLLEDYNTVFEFGSGGKEYTARITYPETYDSDLYEILLKNIPSSGR